MSTATEAVSTTLTVNVTATVIATTGRPADMVTRSALIDLVAAWDLHLRRVGHKYSRGPPG